MNLSIICRTRLLSFPSVRPTLCKTKSPYFSGCWQSGRNISLPGSGCASVSSYVDRPDAERTFLQSPTLLAPNNFPPNSFKARKSSNDSRSIQNETPEAKVETLSEKPNPLLSIEADRWRGIGIDSSLHCRQSLDVFRRHLESAIEHWRRIGIRPITAKILEEDSDRIPALIGAGFQFHHAQPGYAYLKRWLADEEPDSFPAYANHYLGVAGFVVDEQTDELLVIKERFAPRPMWKLPGGTADSGEDLHQIALREGC